MISRQRKFGPLFTLVVVTLVAMALLIQNVRPRRLVDVHEVSWDGTWEVKTVVRGWPLPYHELIDAAFVPAPFGHHRSTNPVAYSPQLAWNNPHSLSLAANAILGLLMLIATAIVTDYGRRLRTGPFQFGMRTILVTTALVAMIVALLDNGLAHWSALLAPLIAYCLVALPATGGLVLERCMRRSDRRLSGLRSRFDCCREAV